MSKLVVTGRVGRRNEANRHNIGQVQSGGGFSQVGEMTQGELFSILIAVMYMYGPTKRLSQLYNRAQQAIGAAVVRSIDAFSEANNPLVDGVIKVV